ncbi:hemerythrin domain-containing protein [Gordonia sp. MP11Mi]|uniref:Hemerythrin-like domain-containing protein n=1 Tax=Gordonia sp. MP11Mi TaxID=3022769 RepID=A0AA97GX34_9ACTN
MDALSLLKADHKYVLGLLETMLAGHRPGADAGAELRRQVMKLAVSATHHESIEDEVFWPVVRDAVYDGHRLADIALAQEQEGTRMLRRLEDCEAGTAEFEHALVGFAAVAREHIDFEEQQVWPQLRRSFSVEQMEDLERRLAAATAPTRPHRLSAPHPRRT